MQYFSTLAIVLLYLASIAFVPWMLTRLPSDYFLNEERENYLFKDSSPFVRSVFMILKNIVGGILVLAGIAMLFLPGQGLLTMVAGIFLMDFPYKYKIEKWIIRQPVIFKMFNKIRQKADKAPFVV